MSGTIFQQTAKFGLTLIELFRAKHHLVDNLGELQFAFEALMVYCKTFTILQCYVLHLASRMNTNANSPHTF